MIAPRYFDFYNQQNTLLRLGVLDKLSINNTYSLPTIHEASLSINLRELSDFDDSRLIAAVFILRLLSNGRPYISRFGLFQTFHTRSYDLIVAVKIGKREAYNLITVLAERVLPFLAKADLTLNILKKKNGSLVGMTIADLSFIRVVETHSVFFRWHDKVRIDLSFLHADLVSTSLLLSGFKFC